MFFYISPRCETECWIINSEQSGERARASVCTVLLLMQLLNVVVVASLYGIYLKLSAQHRLPVYNHRNKLYSSNCHDVIVAVVVILLWV